MTSAKKNNIALVGLMGAGKSVVAKKLAAVLEKSVIAVDSLIEAREGRSIAEIFRDKGEKHFRQMEKQVLSEIAEDQDAVIDCGGGLAAQSGMMEELKKKRP